MDGTEVADIEHRRIIPACKMFADRPRGVRQGHFPTAEINQTSPELEMLGIET
jgi:hypothetical protein